jgi:hypothetical protein
MFHVERRRAAGIKESESRFDRDHKEVMRLSEGERAGKRVVARGKRRSTALWSSAQPFTPLSTLPASEIYRCSELLQKVPA